MKLIGYCRVSTEEQATEGVSLEAQEARLRAYCAAFGHELVETVVDAGVSAKSLKRPGIRRGLKMLRSKLADGLLVAKLDRLTRSVRDLADLVEKYFATGKGSLVSVAENIDTGSAAGRMMLNLLGLLAQWERETIAERTREALGHKKRAGVKLGAVPLGLRRQDGDLVVDAAEQAVLARARELAAGGARLSAIAATLESEGHKTKRGGRWHLTTVRKLLSR